MKSPTYNRRYFENIELEFAEAKKQREIAELADLQSLRIREIINQQKKQVVPKIKIKPPSPLKTLGGWSRHEVDDSPPLLPKMHVKREVVRIKVDPRSSDDDVESMHSVK